jgi:hypothetical protein
MAKSIISAIRHFFKKKQKPIVYSPHIADRIYGYALKNKPYHLLNHLNAKKQGRG